MAKSKAMKKYKWAILLATLYLAGYVIWSHAGATVQQLSVLFVLSPVPVLYMVYQILTQPYKGKALEEGQEFGYADRPTPTTIM